MIWLVPVLLVVLLFLLAWFAGKSVLLTDREQYYFNGDPVNCIACGRAMLRTVWPAVYGVVTTVRCPEYNGRDSTHEFYRWIDYAQGA